MRSFHRIFGVFLMISLLVYVFFFSEDVNKHQQCKEKEEFIKSSFECQVNKKYVDYENHAFRTINFLDCKSFILKGSETSGLFEFVNEGDILMKKYGTEEVVVIRGDEQFVFKIYLPCFE